MITRDPFGRRLMCVVTVLVGISSMPVSAQVQQARHQPGWPCEGRIDPTYVRVAEATGGRVILTRPDEIAKAPLMDGSTGHDQVVFRASARVSQGTYEFDVPIDSTIESAQFYVTFQCLQSVTILRASGAELRADAPDVQSEALTAIRMFTVAKPEPGLWKVQVTGRGVLSVTVGAETSLQLASFRFVENGITLKDEPRPGSAQRVVAGLSGPADRIEFRFVSWAASPLQALSLALTKESESDRMYEGDATIPASPFRFAITGVDGNGYQFQRLHPHGFNSSAHLELAGRR